MQQPEFGKFGGKVGIALAAVGLIAILIGYNGAAGQLTILGQLPYVISGGVLGIAFVILGAAMLVVQSHREDRARLEAKLDELVEAIGGSAAAGPARHVASPSDLSGLVVAGTASYHTAGCRLVDGREETSYLTPAEAQERELKACRVCQPDLAQTNVTVR
ncbi:MAG: hypothetical protein Q8R60_16190 [Mycobacteriales bacterium]|nr:hypothetical protein [Mycobacteriales bacterium]